MTDSGRAPGTYYYYVTQVDRDGTVSGRSNVASAKVGATATPTPTPSPTPTPTPTPTPSPAPVTGKAPSSTKASWKPSTTRKGKVSVVVSSTGTPTGPVVVKDKGRTIARASLKQSHRGRIVVTLPRMRAGKHVLVASYRGSATTSASSSAKRTVRLR